MWNWDFMLLVLLSVYIESGGGFFENDESALGILLFAWNDVFFK